MPNLSKGIERAEEINEQNRSSGWYRVKVLYMKDGEGPWFLRFLTELADMTTADTHAYCETKGKPKEYTGTNWPDHMPAICQNDRMFRIWVDGRPTDDYEDPYGNCYIHNRDRGKPRGGKFKGDKSTPSTLTYSLAVVRQPVLDPVTKRVIGYCDSEVEYKMKDGTVKKIPEFVIIAQTYRMFWAGLEASVFEEPKVLGERDFRITRKENDYSFGVSAPDHNMHPGSESWKRYTDALELVGFDLDEEILRQASPDWYARWYVEGAIPEGGYGRKDDDAEDSTEESTASAQEGERPSEEAVSDFREKLQTARS